MGAVAGGVAAAAMLLVPRSARGGAAAALAGAALIGAGVVVARAQLDKAGWPKPSWTGKAADTKAPTEAEIRTFDPAWTPPGTSSVGREAMEMEGKRFLGSITTDLSEQPLRVYAGLGNGATVDERVQFAIARMHELGAFDKSRILVIQPTSSGYVHDSPVAAAEVLTDGDVATVAVQYNNTAAQSIEAITTLKDGAEVNERLLLAIKAEIDKLPAGAKKPEVFAYGESQGAWGSSMAAAKGGAGGQFEQLGLTRAMWSGMPGFSNWRTDSPDLKALHYDDPAKLKATSVNDLGDTRVIEVVNDNDPINRLDLSLLYKRPDWLGADRPSSVPSGMTWIPGITALQVGLDGDTAIRHWRDGEFRPGGHDYRSTHAKGMQLTLGLPDLSAEQLDAVNTRLKTLGDRSDRLYEASKVWDERHASA